MKSIHAAIVLFCLLFLFASSARCDWKEEERKIQYLLQEVARLDGVFIRNGLEYPPAEAAAHLKMKLEKAMDSWFAPDQSQWTAEMFIDRIASKSSMSGEPYAIKFKDGRTVPAGDWLHERLKAYHDRPIK